jgi:chromosome segregation ATPase
MHPLRATQKGYADRIAGIDNQISNHQKQIDALTAQRKEQAQAKSAIDELVAKLPPEPKVQKPEVKGQKSAQKSVPSA